jgi:Na+/H+-dicarboxylate symporter
MKNLGRLGFRAFVWFELATTVALAIGLLFVNWLRPGDGLTVGQQIDPSVAQAAQNK